MKRDIVLVINGGGMVGIFSMGVFKAFQDNNLLKRVHAIYATSGGADNSAYFMSGQADYGKDFYLHDLSTDKFIDISFGKFLKYIYQLIRHKINSNYKVKPLINLNHPIWIAKESKKKLDLDKIDLDKIHFYVKLFSLKYYEHRYCRLNKDNFFEGLKATSNAIPLTYKPIKLHNEEFLDGDSIKSDITLEPIKKHLEDKIVIRIENFPIPKMSLLTFFITLPKLILGSFLVLILFGPRLFRKYIINFYKYYNYSDKIPYGVMKIQNDLDASMLCRDNKKLEKIYENGVKLGEDCLYKLNLLEKKREID